MSEWMKLFKMSAIAAVVVFVADIISWHLSGKFLDNRNFWHMVILGYSIVLVLYLTGRLLEWRLKLKAEQNPNKDKKT